MTAFAQRPWCVGSRNTFPVAATTGRSTASSKEVVAAKKREGTFHATLRTAYFDRDKGRPVDETEPMGSNLEKPE